MIVRDVTDQEVGELGRFWTRRRGRSCMRFAGQFDEVGKGPVEYKLERRGRRWAVVGYQCVLRESA